MDAHGDRVAVLTADLTDPESITALATSAPDVQVVVNNGGILRGSPLLEPAAIKNFKTELEVNTFGWLRVAQTLAPVIESNGGGAMVQLNSVASIKNFADFTTYCASKSASYSITQGLKDVLEPKGIQVLSVHPGPIATDMAVEAGFGDMGDSVSTVSEGIVAALKSGDFHLFPDTMAQQVAQAYDGFRTNIVEVDLMEA